QTTYQALFFTTPIIQEVVIMFLPYQIAKGPFAHTYSIVARDEVTGEIGAGVQSHWFCVGTVVPWALAGVGAVVTQSFTNPAFGPQGLELLSRGIHPQEVVETMVQEDAGRDFRQLAIIDPSGRSYAHTGEKCVAEAGHLCGKNYSVQANMMLSDRVWPEMAKAFEGSDGPLAERILSALEAAESAGGDIRGRQSAAILVVKGKSTGSIWKDRAVDLRVDDHTEPLKEMGRLLRVHRAYESMDAGDAALEKGDMPEALNRYSQAETLFPENEEMVFWHAVGLANNGRFEEAIPLFRKTFSRNANWKILIERLPASGILRLNKEQIRVLLKD
ncbi:MAG: DUF1028 domain-containing protein, partial [Methanomassiliicoccales archaeon]|nr:DUF1028 domain-containing protein [Methanomassiliicoccales archaeon]